MKTIAIITGATGGIGKEFVKELVNYLIDEIWVIGRDENKLNELTKEFGNKVMSFKIDLNNISELNILADALKKEDLTVSYLINNAGIAKMKASNEFTNEEIINTINLNCTTPVILINMILPYMKKGSHILNISSASSFNPVPYINLYASTKAFEKSYSRALNVELKKLGISVTAVCPSWVDTKMLTKEINGKKVKFKGLVKPSSVAKKALKDAKKGKDMSICSLYVKLQYLNVKLMPQRLTMKIWMKEIKDFI